MGTANTRIEWIDQLKGFAMIFIVLGHMTMSKQMPHVIYCYSFHIPLFFMISGMTARMYRDRHPLETENIWKFIGTKARQLLLPYLLWNIICIPITYIIYPVLQGKGFNLINLLKGMVYSNQDKFRAPTDPMWFVLTLFLAIILFDLLERIFKENSRSLMIVGGVGFLLTFADSISGQKFIYPWHIQAVPAAIFFLALGYYFMEKHKEIINSFEKMFKNVFFRIAVIVVMHVIAVVLALKNGKTSMPGSVYGSPILYLIVIFLMSWVLIYVAVKLKPFWLFTFIGKNTITYMALQCILLALAKALFPGVKDMLQSFGGALLVTVIIIAVLIPISMFVNRFLPVFVGKKYKKKNA